MRIIAFGHRQRVGKDTAGRFMITYLRSTRPGILCNHLSIFDPVKDIAAQLYCWAGMQNAVYYENHPDQKDSLLPAIGKTPRQIMLELGYALIQISDRTVPELALQGQSSDLLILTGVRRKMEIEYVHKFKGVYIDIERDVPKLESIYKGHPAYELDSDLDGYQGVDYHIKNNDSLREFNKQICVLTEIILKRFNFVENKQSI